MNASITKSRTHVRVDIDNGIESRWYWRIALSAGIQSFSLGIVLSRPAREDRWWQIAIGLGLVLFRFELWHPTKPCEPCASCDRYADDFDEAA